MAAIRCIPGRERRDEEDRPGRRSRRAERSAMGTGCLGSSGPATRPKARSASSRTCARHEVGPRATIASGPKCSDAVNRSARPRHVTGERAGPEQATSERGQRAPTPHRARARLRRVAGRRWQMRVPSWSHRAGTEGRSASPLQATGESEGSEQAAWDCRPSAPTHLRESLRLRREVSAEVIAEVQI